MSKLAMFSWRLHRRCKFILLSLLRRLHRDPVPDWLEYLCSLKKSYWKIVLLNKISHLSFVPDIDECASSPCLFGNCTDRVNRYVCNCVPGYTGFICDTGICIDVLKFVCSEALLYTCKYISFLDINECGSSPCRHGSCVNQINNYQCICDTGYYGRICSKCEFQNILLINNTYSFVSNVLVSRLHF